MNNFIEGLLAGLLFCIALVFSFYFGAEHERRNIMDYGGFTQAWTTTQWRCEVKK
jgi:hypothetical protein